MKLGVTYTDTRFGDIYVLTGTNYPTLTWTKITGGSGNLPPSSSSDAGKVLTVDQNGDPDWENIPQIFYGNGTPGSNKSDYENVKVDDLYIDRNKTYALCIYRCVAFTPSNNSLIWRATESDVVSNGTPPTTSGVRRP